MKRLGKKLVMMAVMVVMVLGVMISVQAKEQVTKRITQGGGGYGVEGVTYCNYVKTTRFSKTIKITQKKGKLYYKKANGSLTTVSSYGKFKVVIKENNRNGKVVAQKTCWNNGTYKFKGKANKCYFVEVTYLEPVKGKVLVGPLYRQNSWKKLVHWKAKAVWF